jgi:hypothetical protein
LCEKERSAGRKLTRRHRSGGVEVGEEEEVESSKLKVEGRRRKPE